MSEVSAVKELLIAPGRCRISKNRKNISFGSACGVDDLPESLVLGCGSIEDFCAILGLLEKPAVSLYPLKRARRPIVRQ